MMLSSNLVVLRRRIATIAAMPARIASAPPPIAQVGVLASRSSKKPGAAFGGSATFGAALVGPSAVGLAGSAVVGVAGRRRVGVVVGRRRGSAFGGSAFAARRRRGFGGSAVVDASGGSTFAARASASRPWRLGFGGAS
jgi:hypothetical protein